MSLLQRKLRRDLRREAPKVAVSVIIVMLGVSGFFAYSQMAANLADSYTSTHDEQGLADTWFELEPTPQTDLSELAARVAALQPRLHLYGRATPPGGEVMAEVLGLPATQQLNRLRLISGEGLEATATPTTPAGEVPVVLEAHFVEHHGGGLNSTFALILPTLNGSRVTVTARVVGLAVSPEYLVVTGNQGLLVPRPGSVGVLFMELERLQNLTGHAGLVNQVAVRSSQSPEALLAGLDLNTRVRTAYGDEQQESAAILHQDIDGLKQITPPLSALTLLVAGFSISANLYRLVHHQRRQVGVLRALGTTRGRVLRHYAGYGLAIGLLGAAAGLLLGGWEVGWLTDSYAATLGLPEVVKDLRPELALAAVMLGVGASLLFALLPARHAASMVVREAMNPTTPETTTPLLASASRGWPLAGRLAVRNLGRNRLRTLLTTGGLALALVTPLALGGILASFDRAVDGMFDLPEWDGSAVFDARQPGMATLAELEALPQVERASPFLIVMLVIHDARVYTVGLSPDSLMRVPLDDGGYFSGFTGPDEIVVDTIFADEHGLERGDRVAAELLGQPHNLTVAGIHTKLTQHSYMNLSAAQSWLAAWDAAQPTPRLPPAPISGAYLHGDMESLADSPDLPPYVLQVITRDGLRGEVDELMELFTFYVNLFYLIGAVMGLLIITNAATMNLLEREQELATLKTLGAPTGMLVTTAALENVAMGLVGGIAGIAISYAVTGWLLGAFTAGLFYVPLYLPASLTLPMLAATVLLSLAATLPAWLRLRRMDLGALVRGLER